MAEAGLVVDDSAMTCEVPSYPDIAPDALYPFLTRTPRLTAVFAANDQIAVAVYRVARELGLRIPQDLALVGFGNLDFTSQLDVPLTTVSMPALDMGYMAARTLIQRAGNAALPIQRMIMPTELVIRQSCGGA
jgi:LacI family transcriptional regulator